MGNIIKYPAQLVERFLSRAGHGFTLVRGSSKKLNINFINKEEPTEEETVENTESPVLEETPPTTKLPTLETDLYTFGANGGMFTTFFFGEFSFNTITFTRLAELMNSNSLMTELGFVFEATETSLTIKATKEDQTIPGFSWTYTQDLSVIEDVDHPIITVNNKSYSEVKFISTQENIVATPEEVIAEEEVISTEPVPEEPEVIPVPKVEPVRKSLVTDELTLFLDVDSEYKLFELGDIRLDNASLDLIRLDIERLYPDVVADPLPSGIALKLNAKKQVNLNGLTIVPVDGGIISIAEANGVIPEQYSYPGIVYDELTLLATVEEEPVPEEEPTIVSGDVVNNSEFIPPTETNDVSDTTVGEPESTTVDNPEVTAVETVDAVETGQPAEVIPPEVVADPIPPLVTHYLEVTNHNTDTTKRFSVNTLISGDTEELQSILNSSPDTSIVYDVDNWRFDITRTGSTPDTVDHLVTASFVIVSTHADGREETMYLSGDPVNIDVQPELTNETVHSPVINTVRSVVIKIVGKEAEVINNATTGEGESNTDSTTTTSEENSENSAELNTNKPTEFVTEEYVDYFTEKPTEEWIEEPKPEEPPVVEEWLDEEKPVEPTVNSEYVEELNPTDKGEFKEELVEEVFNDLSEATISDFEETPAPVTNVEETSTSETETQPETQPNESVVENTENTNVESSDVTDSDGTTENTDSDVHVETTSDTTEANAEESNADGEPAVEEVENEISNEEATVVVNTEESNVVADETDTTEETSNLDVSPVTSDELVVTTSEIDDSTTEENIDVVEHVITEDATEVPVPDMVVPLAEDENVETVEEQPAVPVVNVDPETVFSDEIPVFTGEVDHYDGNLTINTRRYAPEELIRVKFNGKEVRGPISTFLDSKNIPAEWKDIEIVYGLTGVLEFRSKNKDNPIEIRDVYVRAANDNVQVYPNYEFEGSTSEFRAVTVLLAHADTEPYMHTHEHTNVAPEVNTIDINIPDLKAAAIVIDSELVVNHIDDYKGSDKSLREELEVFLNMKEEDGVYRLRNITNKDMAVAISVLVDPDVEQPVFSGNPTLEVTTREFRGINRSYKVYEFGLAGV